MRRVRACVRARVIDDAIDFDSNAGARESTTRRRRGTTTTTRAAANGTAMQVRENRLDDAVWCEVK